MQSTQLKHNPLEDLQPELRTSKLVFKVIAAEITCWPTAPSAVAFCLPCAPILIGIREFPLYLSQTIFAQKYPDLLESVILTTIQCASGILTVGTTLLSDGHRISL